KDQDRDRLRTSAEHEATRNEIVPVRTSGAPAAAALSRMADRAEPAAGPSPAVASPSVSTPATSPTVPAEPPTVIAVIGWAGSILLAAWLMGAAVLGARLLVGHRRMAGLRSAAVPAELGAEVPCEDRAQRMGLSPPAGLRTPSLSSPCLAGLRRPAILLPDDAVQNLRETFIHELAHLARRDGLWNLLRQAATAALWLQPLLWVLSRRIEETT